MITATNRDLKKRVKEKNFREDLYYRLKSLEIYIPPLRERKDDIPKLAVFYVTKICERLKIQSKKLSPEFLEALVKNDWPGNVRELINTIEHAIVIGRSEPVLYQHHLPENIRISSLQKKLRKNPVEPLFNGYTTDMPSLQTVRDTAIYEAEKKYLETLKNACNGNIALMQKKAGISRSRIYHLLKKYNISK